MKNWYKKNREKVINLMFKFAGIYAFMLALLYLIGIIEPGIYNTVCTLLALGLMFIGFKIKPLIVLNATLDDYLIKNYTKGIIDHTLRFYLSDKGNPCFYIHASGVNSDTLDFEVKNNYLINIDLEEKE